MKRRTVLTGLAATAAAGALGMPSILRAQTPISLNGAVQFNDDHAFTKALVRFEELVKKYYGQPVNFTLHKNSSLGLEKQYFEYMSQGKAVDYGIVSPAHMSTFAKAAPFIDAPFVFDQPINGASFTQWVEEQLCPTLGPGDIVVLDNLGTFSVEEEVVSRERWADSQAWQLAAWLVQDDRLLRG